MNSRLTLAVVIGLACFQVTQAQEARPQLPVPQETKPIIRAQENKLQLPGKQQSLEEQLIDRFNKVLAEKLENKDVSLSFSAGRYLDYLVRRAARVVMQEKKMDDLPKAEENFRLFASALIEAARQDSSEIRITEVTIDRLMTGGVGWNPNPIPRLGLCPLFPICK